MSYAEQYIACIWVQSPNSLVPSLQHLHNGTLISLDLLRSKEFSDVDRYEFYYDVILGGQYTFHIKTLHDTYGPIIRINPWELHVYSPQFHEELYAGSNKVRDRWEFFTKKANAEQSTFSTTSHTLHRMRRAALNPFFSTASVNTLQPAISQKVKQFLDRIREYRNSGEVLVISDAFAAFANGVYHHSSIRNWNVLMMQDVVMEYSFSNSQNRVAHPTFDPDFHHAAMNGLKRGYFLKHFNWIIRLRNLIPEPIAVRLHHSFREALYIRSVHLHAHAPNYFLSF